MKAEDVTLYVRLSEMKLDHKPDKKEYMELYRSFYNTETDIFGLIAAASEGRVYGAQFKNAPNVFKRSSVISVDLEKHPEANIDKAIKHPFFQAFGAFAYTTLSHTEETPRCRLVFITERAIEDRETYKKIATAIFAPWTHTGGDKSCTEPDRSFLGSPNGKFIYHGKFISAEMMLYLGRKNIKEEILRVKQEARSYKVAPQDPSDRLKRAAEIVASAQEGSRNITLNKIAFAVGARLVAKGLVSRKEAHETLLRAAISCGLDEKEAQSVIRRAIQAGEMQNDNG